MNSLQSEPLPHQRILDVVRAMGEWSGFGSVSMVLIQCTVDAALRGKMQISEAELCSAIYGDDDNKRHRLHSLMRNIRRRALPVWYAGQGRFDPIRLSYPTQLEKPEKVGSAYLPEIQPAFSYEVCRAYARRHGLRQSTGGHPLMAVTGADDNRYLAVAGVSVRRNDDRILILPLQPDVPVVDALLESLIKLPTASGTPPCYLRLQKHLIDYLFTAAGTVLLDAGGPRARLRVTPKLGEELYLGWLFADLCAREVLRDTTTRKLFLDVPLGDLQALVEPVSHPVDVTEVLLVDDTHAAPTEIVLSHMESEFKHALAGTNGSRERIKEVLGGICALSPRVKRVGVKALHDALWDGATRALPSSIVRRLVIDIDERNEITVRVYDLDGPGTAPATTVGDEAAIVSLINHFLQGNLSR